MKYFTILFVTLGFSFVFSQNASKYMNNISNEAKLVRSVSWEYTNSVLKNKSAAKVEKNRQELIHTIEKSEAKIKDLSDFKGKTYYRDSVMSFLGTYKEVISIDYQKLLTIESTAKNALDQKDKSVLIKEEANTKMMLASEMMDAVEKEFATEFGVNITQTKSKVAERLKRTNTVFKYYNSVFILFFAPYYEEALFLEALEKGDLNAMELHRAALAAKTKENQAKLNLKLDFEGDGSVVNSAQKLLDFYQEEAEKDFKAILEFQTFKANYLKTKTNLEAQPSRTKEEVANFNKLVAEYNQRMEVYNALIIDLNTRRETLINAWNIIGGDFETKHLN